MTFPLWVVVGCFEGHACVPKKRIFFSTWTWTNDQGMLQSKDRRSVVYLLGLPASLRTVYPERVSCPEDKILTQAMWQRAMGLLASGSFEFVEFGTSLAMEQLPWKESSWRKLAACLVRDGFIWVEMCTNLISVMLEGLSKYQSVADTVSAHSW